MFPPPDAYPNDQAAAAQFGKAPPDMNLLAKALKYERGFPWFVFDIFTDYQEIGSDFIYGILNGYTKADDPQWNLYYPGHKIAMPAPLSDGVVTYSDGTPGTVPHYAKDVAAFLSWAAEPIDGRAQEDWRARDDLSHRIRRPRLLHQAARVGRPALIAALALCPAPVVLDRRL